MAGASRPLQRAASGAVLMLVGVVLGAGGAARAESAWVKDELHLNLRTGPGTQYRIQGDVGTGDMLEVVGGQEGWTRVRLRRSDGQVEEGWIPEGYLQAEMPAAMRLERAEKESAELKAKLEQLSSRSEALESQNEELSGHDAGQREEIDRLTRENLELRAGARWPDRIAGAAILGAGMLLGALLRRSRRAAPRVRL